MSATKHYADLANLTLYDELIKDYIDASSGGTAADITYDNTPITLG